MTAGRPVGSALGVDGLEYCTSQHRLDDVNDIAAVLHHRLERTATRPPRGTGRANPRLIAGLIPEPLGLFDDEHRQAIADRKQLIQNRARALVVEALDKRVPWIQRLEPSPAPGDAYGEWLAAASTIAAYRDRYAITSDRPLGVSATSDAQDADRQRALRALREVRTIVRDNAAQPARTDRPTSIDIESHR